MNALKYHWCETSLLSQAVLKHVVSKDFIFKKSVHKGSVLYPAKNEEIYGMVPYQKFFMSCYITFKKKTSTCGSQVSHIWIVLCVNGSNGSTGATHFQPCTRVYVALICSTMINGSYG